MYELKQKTEVTLDHAREETPLNSSNPLQKITGLFRTVTAIPTKVPRSVYEQIQLYVNGNSIRLYFYDTQNNTWRYVNYFTLEESNGSVQLEGRVILGDGSGVTLSRSSQTLLIAAP